MQADLGEDAPLGEGEHAIESHIAGNLWQVKVEAGARVSEGDTLVIWKLDRLGRTMKGLVDLAANLAERKIALRSLTDGIDTSGTAGKLVFHIMAAMAEMERDLTRERTNAALAMARAQGRVGGRKPVMTA